MKNSKEAFINYLQLEKKYSPHTVAAYNSDLEFFEQFLLDEFDITDIENIEYTQIRSWIVSNIESGISNVSVNRKIASLKAYYKFLLKTKQIEINPLIKHKALKTSKKIQIPFSEQEVQNALSLFGEPTDFTEIRNKLIVEIFYSTGMRQAELIDLKTYNVDVSNYTIKVLGKRNKERIIPMLPVLRPQILNYLKERNALESIEDKDRFFVSKKGIKITEAFVYKLINTYFAAVSEKVKRSPHMLRHTFATHLLNNGADLNSVKELLGHSSLASTQVYTHSSLEALKKIYTKAHPRSMD